VLIPFYLFFSFRFAGLLFYILFVRFPLCVTACSPCSSSTTRSQGNGTAGKKTMELFFKKKSRGENEEKQKSTQTQMKLTHRKNPPVRKIPQSEKE
jgi:hypothetical protein